MKQYLDIVDYCLSNGTKSENRTGIPTIRIPWGATFMHDMSDGFPLLTTKKMPPLKIFTELEFFIKGITDKKWLQDRNCHIWDEWGNPDSWKPVFETRKMHEVKKLGTKYMTQERETELENQAKDECRDLGPIYGWQWRHWNGEYKWNPQNPLDNFNPEKPGIDQLVKAINTIKNDPNDRGILVHAWNPEYEEKMALRPCHVMHQVLVHDGKLNLIWTQRSCDMFLGIPFNIASYAMLLLLYAKETGYKPGILKGELHDVHIYENHVPQMREQLKREPNKLPTIEIPDENWNGMLNWTARDGYNLKDYIYHEKLSGEVAR